MYRRSVPYELYVGVDWSGKGGRGRSQGLRVATCGPGHDPPTLVRHPRGWNWRRDEVLALLNGYAQEQGVLAGLDFSFAYPYCDVGAYFPGLPESPADARALWARIEAQCAGAPWFHGGPFLAGGSPFAPYLVTQARGRGPLFRPRRRVTETACAEQGATPLCPFHCVGPQVGTGSVAGMRVLHAIAEQHEETWSIWPFEPRDERSTIVEVFPTLFQRQVEQEGQDLTQRAPMNAALAVLETAPLREAPATEDVADALLIAAALRHRVRVDPTVWDPPGLPGCPQTHEGWIFGA
jgi:hypothetical protein